MRGMGDVISVIAKPIAKAIGMDCLDEKGELKPSSPCGKRSAALNKAIPFQ